MNKLFILIPLLSLVACKSVPAGGDGKASIPTQTATWTTVNSYYKLQYGDHILADSTNGTFTMCLPKATGSGAEIDILDPDASWHTFNVTVTGMINGDPTGMVLSAAGSMAHLVDVGGSTGWRVNFIY